MTDVCDGHSFHNYIPGLDYCVSRSITTDVLTFLPHLLWLFTVAIIPLFLGLHIDLSLLSQIDLCVYINWFFFLCLLGLVFFNKNGQQNLSQGKNVCFFKQKHGTLQKWPQKIPVVHFLLAGEARSLDSATISFWSKSGHLRWWVMNFKIHSGAWHAPFLLRSEGHDCVSCREPWCLEVHLMSGAHPSLASNTKSLNCQWFSVTGV